MLLLARTYTYSKTALCWLKLQNKYFAALKLCIKKYWSIWGSHNYTNTLAENSKKQNSTYAEGLNNLLLKILEEDWKKIC